MSTTPFKIRENVPPPRTTSATNEYGEIFTALMDLVEAPVGASFFIPCELSKCEALRKNIGVKTTKIRKKGPDFRDFFVTTAKVMEEVDGVPTQGICVWKVQSAALAAADAAKGAADEA